MEESAAYSVEAGVDVLPQHLLNKVNRDLTAQIAYFENECEKAVREVDEHKERLKFMMDHLGNVKAEIVNTQSLYEAKRREVEGEDHMAQLAERERGRFKQKIEQLSVQQSEIQEKIDAIQNRIFQGNLRMDEYKAAMNFNQEELEQWDLARKQKEDDGQVLQKYSKADEGKVASLNLQIEKLSTQVQKKRKELEDEITETQSSQIELDKTAEDYKALHDEQQYLLQQWEDAVKAMHRRDNAIKAAGDRYAEGKQWVEKRSQQLKARAEFHSAELANNKELEAKIGQEERVLGKYREDHGIMGKHLNDLDDEIEVVRNTLQKAQHDHRDLQSRKDEKERDLENKQKKYRYVQLQHEQMIKKLDEEIQAAGDMQKQNKLVSDLLSQVEQSMKQLDKEISRIKDEQYHNSEELYAVRRQQSNYLAEISGAQAQARNMAAKITQLDQQSFKQQELLYSIEFNIQQMERKVNRAKGERTEEEKKELQEKIEMLQKMLDDLLKQHKELNEQVKHVADDLRHAKYESVRLDKEKQRVTEELLELTLENESCNIEHDKMNKIRQEHLVNVDVLKLQVDRLRKMLQRRDEEVLGMENRKQQLAITITEREMEIKVHHDVLRMESKTAEEERKVVAAELMERNKQVEHLKQRYQVLIGRMEKGQGEMTHAQHIVNTAKEREELQAKGDSLDVEIKKAERESRKLDKTIAVLKGNNAKFKNQFVKVGDQDDEVQQQKLLQQKNKEVQTIVNRRTNEMKEFLRSEMSKMSELQDIQRQKAEQEEQISMLEEGRVQLERDIEEQRELVARYEVAVNKAKRTTEPEIVDDILLLEEQEKVDAIVQMLYQIGSASGDEEVQRGVEGTFHRHNVELPNAGHGMDGDHQGGDHEFDDGEDGM